MISKSLSTSRKYADLSAAGDLTEFCQVLFPLLVSHADDYGRLSGDAFTVKFQVFPISPRPLEDFDRALQQIAASGLVTLYEADGGKVLQVLQFEGHQTGLHKRSVSKFPEPPGNSGKFREIPAQLNRRELNRTELKGTEGKDPSGHARPARARTGSGVMAGTLPRDHVRHAWCSERICVPDFLHARFVQAVGGRDPDGALRAFYAATVGQLVASQPIESDPVKFWPPRVTAQWTPSASNPKTAGNVAAAERWLQKSGV